MPPTAGIESPKGGRRTSVGRPRSMPRPPSPVPCCPSAGSKAAISLSWSNSSPSTAVPASPSTPRPSTPGRRIRAPASSSSRSPRTPSAPSTWTGSPFIWSACARSSESTSVASTTSRTSNCPSRSTRPSSIAADTHPPATPDDEGHRLICSLRGDTLPAGSTRTRHRHTHGSALASTRAGPENNRSDNQWASSRTFACRKVSVRELCWPERIRRRPLVRCLVSQPGADPADRIVEGLLGDPDGGVRVTGVDGAHESALMLEQRIERLGGDLTPGSDELVGPAAHPQRADRLDEHRIAGGRVDGGQQLLVVIEVRRGVACLERRGHRRELLVEPGPPGLGELLHAFDGRVDLEDPAHGIDLQQLLGGERLDHCPSVGAGLDEPDLLEAGERVAHGRDARAQLGGQLPDPQPLSAAVIAVENARLHRFEHLVTDARSDFRLGLAHVRQSILAEATAR